jgi:2-phospho-L-lactate guanylyltransferase
MPDVRSDAQPWAVVVPVKRLELAKTRLSVQPNLRRELALAMATDTVLACLHTAGVVDVVVVTDDELAGPAMRALGANVVPDEPDAGLNPALIHGIGVARTRHSTASVVVLSSDLPSLTPEALRPLLDRAASLQAACVADAAGTGTTVLALGTASSSSPSFGAGSWQRHVDAGAVDLTAYADPRLRRDVDTTADLADAMRLGCGAATVTVVSAHPALLQ